MSGKIKHVFPGGNTAQGFFSYYNYIIPNDANRIFILKGGPGVGKSTFMKQIGEKMTSNGYNIEYHHCSSDNNSLDGLVIQNSNIAFIDGTSPHIVDPKNPGCVDEIINLGQFWNQTQLVANKPQILSCNQEIQRLFQRAYRILRAAKSIYDDWKITNSEALDTAKINILTNQLLSSILPKQNNGAGKLRKLFASAITPDGPTNYLQSIFADVSNIYILNGEPGTGKSFILESILAAALRKGYDAEVYYCALDPVKPEHLLLPQLSCGIITSTAPHLFSPKNAVNYDLNPFLRTELIRLYANEISYAQKTFWELFYKAIETIKKAKQVHDLLESYYIPSMDFNAVQSYKDHILSRIIY